MAIGLVAKKVAKPQKMMEARSHERPDDLFEMANLFPEDTGLPVTVWVSPRGHARHAARNKVCRVAGNRMVPSNTATVRIQPEPRLIEGTLASKYLEPVARWVAENRETLLEYWNGDIGTGALIVRLKKLGSPADRAESQTGR